MEKPESFRKRAFLALLLPISTALVLAFGSVGALSYVRDSERSLVDNHAQALIDTEKLRSALEWKVASNRGFFLTKDTLFLEREEAARDEFRKSLGELKAEVSTPEGKSLFAEIEKAEVHHQAAVDSAKKLRIDNQLEAALRAFESEIFPKREKLRLAILALESHQRGQFEAAKVATREAARRALWLVCGAALMAFLLAGYLSWSLVRRLARVLEAEAKGRREAETALAIRGEFLTVAAHELRTPLAALSMLLQILDRMGAMPVTDSSYRSEAALRVARAVRQVRRVGALIDLLLDATHISSRSLVLSLEKIDLLPLTSSILEEFEDECRLRECAVTFQAPPEPLRVCADPLRLSQALRNLVSNAIKYGDGKPVDVVLTTGTEDIVIAVSDHGPGIAEIDKDRIFGKYERLASAAATGGLGLGLYVARSIVEAHGGELSVVSEPGQGSTFTLRLPRRRPGLAPEKSVTDSRNQVTLETARA